RWMRRDEGTDRVGRRIHDDHGDNYGGNHHLKVLGHADRRQDRIERKHQIDDDKLEHDPDEGLGRRGSHVDGSFARFHFVMDLVRRLGDEEHAATDQDDVTPGYSHSKDAEEWRRESHEPGEPYQHDHPEDERKREPDLAGAPGLAFGKPGS